LNVNLGKQIRMIRDPSVSSGASVKAKNSRAILALALAIGAFLGVLGVSLVSRHADLGRFWSAVSGRSTTLDVSQPTVVDRIQQLQKLETVVYTTDKVVTGERENPIFPDFLAGDRLLLLVHGEVIAGIDFSTLQTTNVSVTGKSVRLRLPDAQVFTTRLDNAKTRVYSRQTGLLAPVDPNLETKVRQEAERQIHEAALADGILKTAQQNARSTITGMLRGLGFEKVDFD
jgi:hypothetical protein